MTVMMMMVMMMGKLLTSSVGFFHLNPCSPYTLQYMHILQRACNLKDIKDKHQVNDQQPGIQKPLTQPM